MILIETVKKAGMILGQAAAEATMFLLKGVAVLVLIALGILLAIILREIAWALRQENIKQMEEKKKNDNGSI